MVENIFLNSSIFMQISIVLILFIVLIIALIIKKRFTKKQICPYCKNQHDLTRVKKNKALKIIPFNNLIRLLCYKCHRKHYRIINTI